MNASQRIKELSALCSTLSRRERYALDAYLANRDEKGSRRQAFELALEETPVWTAATWASRTRLFWQRKDVESYVEMKDIERREAAAATASVTVDPDAPMKDFAVLRRELEAKQRKAEEDGDDEMWLKYTSTLLSYMKQDTGNVSDSRNVMIYVPAVCVDNCPLYRERLIEIQKNRIKENTDENGKEQDSDGELRD